MIVGGLKGPCGLFDHKLLFSAMFWWDIPSAVCFSHAHHLLYYKLTTEQDSEPVAKLIWL